MPVVKCRRASFASGLPNVGAIGGLSRCPPSHPQRRRSYRHRSRPRRRRCQSFPPGSSAPQKLPRQQPPPAGDQAAPKSARAPAAAATASAAGPQPPPAWREDGAEVVLVMLLPPLPPRHYSISHTPIHTAARPPPTPPFGQQAPVPTPPCAHLVVCPKRLEERVLVNMDALERARDVKQRRQVVDRRVGDGAAGGKCLELTRSAVQRVPYRVHAVSAVAHVTSGQRAVNTQPVRPWRSAVVQLLWRGTAGGALDSTTSGAEHVSQQAPRQPAQ
eukprot:359118-Chlamydomonas_euryale.AAC.3